MTTAILLVDVQNDFCPGGALAAPEGDEVIPVLNRLMGLARERSWPIIASRDWHPENSSHFAERGGPWPPHCIQGTQGAEFHPDLNLKNDIRIITKGDDPEEDEGYSAFEGKTSDGTSLGDYLKEFNVQHLITGGLATDYCVKSSVLDALKHGLDVTVLRDGVRAVDLKPGDGEKAMAMMDESGARILNLKQLEHDLK